MNDPLENPHGDARFTCFYVGTVYDRKDPERLGRVRVAIPGLMDQPASGWAFPLGSPGGGGARVGQKWVPPLGAEVGVFFNQGDPDQPWYLPAHWGNPKNEQGEVVTEIPGGGKDAQGNALSPEEAPDVHASETPNFEIFVDDRPGKVQLILRHKVTGDFIEYDGKAFGWNVRATTAFIVNCDGIISLDGNTVQIQGRKVIEGTNPI